MHAAIEGKERGRSTALRGLTRGRLAVKAEPDASRRVESMDFAPPLC
jgi:hypothetical protein